MTTLMVTLLIRMITIGKDIDYVYGHRGYDCCFVSIVYLFIHRLLLICCLLKIFISVCIFVVLLSPHKQLNELPLTTSSAWCSCGDMVVWRINVQDLPFAGRSCLRPFHLLLIFILTLCRNRTIFTPPRWPSGSGVRLESGRSRVRIPLARGFFSGSSHTSDLKIGTPVATLPGAWRYRVTAGTGWPGVSVL